MYIYIYIHIRASVQRAAGCEAGCEPPGPLWRAVANAQRLGTLTPAQRGKLKSLGQLPARGPGGWGPGAFGSPLVLGQGSGRVARWVWGFPRWRSFRVARLVFGSPLVGFRVGGCPLSRWVLDSRQFAIRWQFSFQVFRIPGSLRVARGEFPSRWHSFLEGKKNK